MSENNGNGKLTNGDLRRIRAALNYLTTQPKPQRAQASGYNVFQLRLFRAVSAFKPVMEALDSTERQLVERFEADAGTEAKSLPDGGISFGRLDREFDKQFRELMDAPVIDPPKVVPFTLQEFNAQEIALPAQIMESLGPLLDVGEEA